MKANRKFIQADERAVSAVIGVILMVAITVAIAATVYVYVSGMIGGTKTQTPNVACTTDATANKITVATADSNIRWTDIVVTNDTVGTTIVIWHDGGTSALTPLTITMYVTAGDYLLLTNPTAGSNVKVTLRYIPTNSLLGSWTVNV